MKSCPPPLPLRCARWWLALLLSACGHPDEFANTQAWLAQARLSTVTQAGEFPVPTVAEASMPDEPEPDDIRTEPFAVPHAATVAMMPALSATPAIASAPAPAVRALGVMLQGERGQAVIELDGTLLRLAAGQALPGQHGKIVRISHDEVQLLLDGNIVHLPVGTPREGAARRQEDA